jgi:hypothetical protein
MVLKEADVPIGSRYQPLADYLSSKKENVWDASFEDIERALGRSLPDSAYRYQAWWANQENRGHSQTHGWRSAGWRTARLDLERRRVRFERERPKPAKLDRTPENLDNLLHEAADLSGIDDRDMLVREALRALIAREAGKRLIRLGGTMPELQVPPRERPAM